MTSNVLLIALSAFVMCLAFLPDSAGNHAPSCKEGADGSTTHEPFIRQAFGLAISAGKKGNHPFGALLVCQNKVVLTSENTVYTDRNVYNHAEHNLMVRAKREIPPEVLRECTVYTSTAPCMFCSASIWYMDIKRVVYGVSYETFNKISGHRDKSIHCDRLYQETGKPLEWIGPVLEEEGVKVFWHWPQDPYRSSIVKGLENLGV